MLGLYPTWFEPGVGSGWVIAFIATIHVLFSHASVGSALLFAWLARRSVTHNKPEYLTFIRKYGLFLLIFSYVLGSVTGPGIWFSATLANPRGLSALIHNFVWLWATEWVFFVIEVVGVYMLVYLAGRVTMKAYMKLTAIFAMSSVMTLLIIVGVLSFMLWPGVPQWFETGTVAQAFFGPNTFAQMFTRLFFMLMITGVVGGIVAGRITDPAEKASISRALSTVGILGAVGGAASFTWYMNTLPAEVSLITATRLPGLFIPLMTLSVVLSIAYFVVMASSPKFLTSGVAAVATVLLLVLGLGPEETARETIRKPWTSGQYVYSNQIIGRDVPGLGIKNEVPLLAEKGLLASHPFTPDNLRTVTKDNELEAGRFIALSMCVSCHSLTSTGIRPMKNQFPENTTAESIYRYLGAGLFRGHTSYMPPAPLPEDERQALAKFLHRAITSKDPSSLVRTGSDGTTPEPVNSPETDAPTVASNGEAAR